MEELGLLAADASQEKLRLSLGEPHGWPLGPERSFSIPPLAVSCLQSPCFVWFTNVGSQYLRQQPRKL
jgi:hypothetical protein